MAYFLSIFSIFLGGFLERGWAEDNICSTKRSTVVINKKLNLPMSYCFVFSDGKVAGGYPIEAIYNKKVEVMEDNCSCDNKAAKTTINTFDQTARPSYLGVASTMTVDDSFKNLIKTLENRTDIRTSRKTEPRIEFNKETKPKQCEYYDGDRLLSSHSAKERKECTVAQWTEAFNRGKCITEVVGHTDFHELSYKNLTVCKWKKDSYHEIILTDNDEDCKKHDCSLSLRESKLPQGRLGCRDFPMQKRAGQKNGEYLCQYFDDQSGSAAYAVKNSKAECDTWCIPLVRISDQTYQEPPESKSPPLSPPSSPSGSEKK